jgi:hypothetical protein
MAGHSFRFPDDYACLFSRKYVVIIVVYLVQ